MGGLVETLNMILALGNANNSKVNTVKTQKELEKSLKDTNIKTIVIKTYKNVIFTIGEKDYATKRIIINAPNSTIINRGKFKEVVYIVSTQAQLTKVLKQTDITKLLIRTDKEKVFKLEGKHLNVKVVVEAPNARVRLSGNFKSVVCNKVKKIIDVTRKEGTSFDMNKYIEELGNENREIDTSKEAFDALKRRYYFDIINKESAARPYLTKKIYDEAFSQEVDAYLVKIQSVVCGNYDELKSYYEKVLKYIEKYPKADKPYNLNFVKVEYLQYMTPENGYYSFSAYEREYFVPEIDTKLIDTIALENTSIVAVSSDAVSSGVIDILDGTVEVVENSISIKIKAWNNITSPEQIEQIYCFTENERGLQNYGHTLEKGKEYIVNENEIIILETYLKDMEQRNGIKHNFIIYTPIKYTGTNFCCELTLTYYK